jgi:glyoxylase-like metal-dependent hydrolase (beta-lactamase superfamily II)
MAVEIKSIFDSATYTLTYVVYDSNTRDAVVIDPVLDFDPASGAIGSQSLAKLMSFVSEMQLKVHYILETHAHADHISSAHELVARHLPEAKIAIGERITSVQETFKKIFNFPPHFKSDGSQFHRLFKDGEVIQAGALTVKVLFTPGHTPACVSYLIGDAVFTGDTLFMPDSGTGRCDFPQGDATQLYRSVTQVLYKLPDQTRQFVGHDYQPNGRQLAFQSTIGEAKSSNIHITALTTEAEFVEFRKKRDATLTAPRLLFPSIQVNIAAGEFPEAESNGIRYLKMPLTFPKL